MAAAIVLIPTLAVTGSLHLAGGRADTVVNNGATLLASPAAPPVDPQVLYLQERLRAEHKLAQKRLRLAQWFEQKRNDWKRTARNLQRSYSVRRVVNSYHPVTSTRSVICTVFGAHCSEALRVFWCESRWNVYARNGQYWGLAQFGAYARAQYGFAWNAWAQARAAYRYFLDAGWGPWACKP